MTQLVQCLYIMTVLTTCKITALFYVRRKLFKVTLLIYIDFHCKLIDKKKKQEKFSIKLDLNEFFIQIRAKSNIKGKEKK